MDADPAWSSPLLYLHPKHPRGQGRSRLYATKMGQRRGINADASIDASSIRVYPGVRVVAGDIMAESTGKNICAVGFVSSSWKLSNVDSNEEVKLYWSSGMQDSRMNSEKKKIYSLLNPV